MKAPTVPDGSGTWNREFSSRRRWVDGQPYQARSQESRRAGQWEWRWGAHALKWLILQTPWLDISARCCPHKTFKTLNKVERSFSAPPCTFSGPDRLCRLAPAMVYVPLPETTPLLGRFHLLFFQWFLLFIIIPLVLLAFLNWKHNSLVFLLFSVITVRCMKFPLSAVLV